MFTALTIAALTFISTAFIIKSAEAQTDYTIEQVEHTIEVMYNGYIFINDTIQITGSAPDGFLIGFPYKYGSHVLRCVAFNATNTFTVNLNVPLEGRTGFYAVKIEFQNHTPQVFTVGFLLSNNLQNFTQNVLDFPAYPSLTKTTALCNVTINLPGDFDEVTVVKDDGAVNGTVYFKENLQAFAFSPANLTFSSTGDGMQIFDIVELKREVQIDGAGGIQGSDDYYITSKTSKEISFIEIVLPPNASKTTVRDQFGRKVPGSGWVPEKIDWYRVAFTSPLESYKSTRFTVRYELPSEVYVAREEVSDFVLTFQLLKHLDHYINQFSVSVVLPEGAKVISENASANGSYSITRDIFRETITIKKLGVISLESFSLEIAYQYNLLWSSFRPTLWMWTLALVGCIVAAVWKRPQVPFRIPIPRITVRASPEQIRTFVSAYEDRRKGLLDIEALETRVRKGRIPRRRYKVRRKTLETRLNALSGKLTDLKEKLRASGGLYRDLMRQLEIAETEIKGIQANIKTIETRHRTGELSLGAYRKLLADYKRRKDKSETIVDGVLVRLREEIR